MTPAQVSDRLAGCSLVIAHLSDPHVKEPGCVYTGRGNGLSPEANNARFADALAEVEALPRRPDVLVLSGDLAEEAGREEYAIVLQMLASLEVERLVVPGNHDRRDLAAFRESLAMEPGGLVWKREVKGWSFLGIDTSACEDTEPDTLSPALEAAGQAALPCVVVSHSPLLPVGNWMDRMSFHDPGFVAALAGTGSVRAVLAGHVHRFGAWRHQGVAHLTTGSVSYGIEDQPGYALIGFEESGGVFQIRRHLPLDDSPSGWSLHEPTPFAGGGGKP